MTARSGARCRAILLAVRSVRDRSTDARERLLIADSVSSATVGVLQIGHDRLALARAWEQFGDLPRALAAIRLRAYGFGALLVEATRCREEGRLAALVGDTTSAKLAYRRYLALRQDAEPALIPQRDSVRAALARLEGR